MKRNTVKSTDFILYRKHKSGKGASIIGMHNIQNGYEFVATEETDLAVARAFISTTDFVIVSTHDLTSAQIDNALKAIFREFSKDLD